jgi:hypothetical protein
LYKSKEVRIELPRKEDGSFHCPCGFTRPSPRNVSSHVKACKKLVDLNSQLQNNNSAIDSMVNLNITGNQGEEQAERNEDLDLVLNENENENGNEDEDEGEDDEEEEGQGEETGFEGEDQITQFSKTIRHTNRCFKLIDAL